MTFRQWPPATLSVEYLVKAPDKVRCRLTSRRTAQPGAHDEFEYKEGMICVASGGRLAIWNPCDLKVTEVDLGALSGVDTTFTHHGTGAIPGVGPYVQGMYYLADPDNFDTRLVGLQELDGTKAYALELVAKRAVKAREPWDVAKETLWVDAHRFVALKSELRDPHEKVVSTTTYGAVRQVADGVWVALQSETRAEPGTIHVRSPVTVTKGDGPRRAETWEADVPYGGRVVRREFQWLDGKALVPKTVEVTDLDGNMLSRAVFQDYQLDTGIPDSEFDVLSPGQ
jgi:hypothetical protein